MRGELDGRLRRDGGRQFHGAGAAPGGWSTGLATPATFAIIAPGQTVQTAWRVPVPAAAKPGSYEPGVNATFGSPGDGATQPVTAGGMEGREAVPTNPTHPDDLGMYFSIDGNIAFDSNYTAIFTCEYYDKETGSFLPQYDSTNPKGGDLIGACAPGPAVPEANTGTWKTVSFTVNNALFANRENDSIDFRITSPDPFIIHSVTVTISASG